MALYGVAQGGANHGLRAYCIAEIVSMGAPASGKKGKAKKGADDELTVRAVLCAPRACSRQCGICHSSNSGSFCCGLAGTIWLGNGSRLCS